MLCICIYTYIYLYIYLYLHKYMYIHLIMGRIPNLVMKRQYTGTKLSCFMTFCSWFLSFFFEPDLILHYPRPFSKYTNSQAPHPCPKMSLTIDLKKVHESAWKCIKLIADTCREQPSAATSLLLTLRGIPGAMPDEGWWTEGRSGVAADPAVARPCLAAP